MRARHFASAVAVAAAVVCAPAMAQVQRSFVASYGNDSNVATNCGFSAPCRGFTAAHGVTNSNGEIVALDSAGYGAITITKSISILSAPGFYAGISVASGNAVTIATAAVKVRLSGLKINATGGAPIGVNMTNGAALNIDNCAFTGFQTAVLVNTGAQVRISGSLFTNNANGASFDGGANVAIANSEFLGNTSTGVILPGGTATTTSVVVTNSVASHSSGTGFLALAQFAGADLHLTVSNSSSDSNNFGFVSATTVAGASSIVVVGSSKATRNGVNGFVQSAGGGGTAIFRSAGNNVVSDNGADTSGTITNIGTM